MSSCKIQCAISGIEFHAQYLDGEYIPASAGYFHPIFAADYSQLNKLYSKHCRGMLPPTDSYLLFLAFLHSSGKVEWNHHATLNPHNSTTIKLIENNLTQLIEVLNKSACIRHPAFSQPSFTVYADNSRLASISNWIAAWQENLDDFLYNRAEQKTLEEIQKVENKLSYLILSGEKPEKFSHVIADWADKASEFPAHKAELYKKTIRSCFNTNKMFNTPLELLREIKEHCECNIDSGSIHFHTLMQVIKAGIRRHTDYLGGGSLARGYTLLESLPDKVPAQVTVTTNLLDPYMVEDSKNTKAIESVAANAPVKLPREEDYESSVDYIKAKLAYRVACNMKKVIGVKD